MSRHSLRSALAACGGSLWIAAALACGHHSSATPVDAGQDAGDSSDAGPDAGAPDAGTGGGGDAGHVAVVVRAIYPAQGPAAGGGSALVSGSGFVNGFAARGGAAVASVTTVKIGGTTAPDLDVIDDNRLTVTIPAGAGGPADVTVTNPNGTGACKGCYRYQAPIAVRSISPGGGPSAGGTAVTVKGDGFVSGMLVLVGQRPLSQLVVVDAQTATGVTAGGPAGGADVQVLTRDAQDTLADGFLYEDALALTLVDPSFGASAGGTRVTVTGAGFSPQAAASFDGVPAKETNWVDAQHLAVVTPAHAAGAVTVSVSDPQAVTLDGGTAAAPGATVQLPRGFVFVDAPDGGSPGTLFLGAVTPQHGPSAGGACPTACVTLVGSGLSLPDLTVTIGAVKVQPSSLHPRGDHLLDVDLPPAAAPGAVALTVSSAAQGTGSTLAATDPGAFHYDPLLAVTAVTPAHAPAAGGGVAVTVSGAGFDRSPGAPIELRIGALPATAVTVSQDGRSISAVAPAGAPGAADVTVTVTDADGYRRSATLPQGFFFDAPLFLAQVSPATGSQAGGTKVTLFGQAFTPGMTVKFGGALATNLALVSSSEATVLTPPGTPGAVDVTVAQGSGSDTLAAAFTYFDPKSEQGGLGGGPLRGTLNVTVIDATPYVSGGASGATVTVDLAQGAELSGLTDGRGQITFADDRLDLPCTVTVTKPQYNAITVGGIVSADLSVYLSGPAGPPPPPPDPPPPPPPPPQTATIGGHVLGFKLPPSVTLGPSERLAAHVSTAASGIYSAPPFQAEPKYQLVLTDGGSYSFTTQNFSPRTLYATFGVEDQSQSPPRFTPYLLGVLRGVQPDAKKPLTNADIILDTHLDQTVTVTASGLPATPLGPIAHNAAVTLDLGTAGAIPLGHLIQATPLDTLRFDHLPRTSAQGFVFVDLVGLYRGGDVTTPVSWYLRRVFADPGATLAMGPYLPFPVIQQPQGGAFTGSFAWSIDGALAPDLVTLQVGGQGLSWSVVLPGSARQLTPPQAILGKLSPGTYYWSITDSLAPGFDYANWTYADLYSGSWTAYAYDSQSFTVKP